MYFSSTPLRISLFGGSTDHPSFIKKYKKSIILNFSCNLKTHVVLYQDKYGYNTQDSCYSINYSKREITKKISNINNSIIKIVFNYFAMPPVSVNLFSDIFSNGSGLASSSSFILSLIEVCSKFQKVKLSKLQKINLSLQLERKINPNCGYQDPFGCALGGFNLITSKDDKKYIIKKLSNTLFKKYNFYLYPTGINRKSKIILDKLSNKTDKIIPIYDIALKAYGYLLDSRYSEFINLINQSWYMKKKTDKNIVKNKIIKDIDIDLINNKSIIAHKLLGAGNGGFFLCVMKKNEILDNLNGKKLIKVDLN